MRPRILLTACLLAFLIGHLNSQDTRSFPAENVAVLIIANINGNVSVEGSKIQEIVFEVESKSGNDKLQSVVYKQIGDTLVAYIESTCNQFEIKNQDDGDHWGFYKWENNCKDEDPAHIDFKVVVPATLLKVLVSTINDGDIVVGSLTPNQEVAAKNINGSIKINTGRIRSARTINGDVDLAFSPGEILAGDFYTLNGDIRAFFPNELNAHLSFESYNGDFFTNSSDVKVQPIQAEKKKDADGFHVKIGGKSLMQFGQGGPELKFETFNGDVIVKVNSL